MAENLSAAQAQFIAFLTAAVSAGITDAKLADMVKKFLEGELNGKVKEIVRAKLIAMGLI